MRLVSYLVEAEPRYGAAVDSGVVDGFVNVLAGNLVPRQTTHRKVSVAASPSAGTLIRALAP